jgi:NAD(P) transhydrogenase subunit alpha
MSGSNFIHGIVVVGSMVVLGHADTFAEQLIGFLGVMLGAANAAGGYAVTERMLEMFERKPKVRASSGAEHSRQVEGRGSGVEGQKL